ncbi:aldehyde dehydrogenase family protein [Christensenella timonensis]|uniref:aldehyde dehydrogenase family protein n=1 Tax=Christensenella timonensis TaxID=1816678 RepID=UPI00082A4BC4|nr:aldehyde dehydrogenase family protein [Christensenella timonensis]
MNIDTKTIEYIVKEVLAGIGQQPDGVLSGYLFDTADQAVAAVKKAQHILAGMALEERQKIIHFIRKETKKNAEYLARLAWEETGFGKVRDKIVKNTVAAVRTPGTEDLTPVAYTGDYGLTLVEQAPFGVIGSVTPSTNPTSSIINNAISMVAAGNGVVFNPHPGAKKCSQETLRIIHEAIVAAGGPASLVAALKEPSMEGSLAVMKHPDVKLLSITGGEAVVKVAMGTGKKVVAAGPGNPPVIVDDTADIEKAAKDIVDGASFDNCVLCVAEKEVFVFDNVAEQLMGSMEQGGAFRARGEEIQKIVGATLQCKDGKYVINRKMVGKDASVILKASGVDFSGEPRLIIADVPAEHPFVTVEMLMPVMGIVRVHSIDEAIREAVRAEAGCKHSAMIHSTNVHHLSMAAKALNTTIFVKNGPSSAGFGVGGEGYTTFTIATPTGEGLTSAKSFTRARRCVLYGDLNFI